MIAFPSAHESELGTLEKNKQAYLYCLIGGHETFDLLSLETPSTKTRSDVQTVFTRVKDCHVCLYVGNNSAVCPPPRDFL
jgi:hypothetical protein